MMHLRSQLLMISPADCRAFPQCPSSAKLRACRRLMGDFEPQPEPINQTDRQQRALYLWAWVTDGARQRSRRLHRYRFVLKRALEKLRQIRWYRKTWSAIGRILSKAKSERKGLGLPEDAPLDWVRNTTKAAKWFGVLGNQLRTFAGRDRAYAIRRETVRWPHARSNVALRKRGPPCHNINVVHLRPWDSDRYYTGGGMRYLMPQAIEEQRMQGTVPFSWHHPHATIGLLANARVGAIDAERRGTCLTSKWWRNVVVIPRLPRFPPLTPDAYQDTQNDLRPVTGASRLD